MKVLNASNLCFGFENSGFSVKDVSLDVWSGEILGFLGKNGAGKTTVMRLILKVLPLLSGEIQFLSAPLQRSHFSSIGVLIERGIMYPNLSADENLHFHCGLRGLEKSCAKSVVRELKIDFGTKTVKQLSAGMRQKLGIAIALLGNPKLMLLDEPFAGLDPAAIEESLAILRKFAAGGGAILFSSHQLYDVERIATHITVIKAGEMVRSASLTALLSSSTQLLQCSDPERAVETLISAGINAAQVDKSENDFQIGGANSSASSIRIHSSIATSEVIKRLFSAGIEIYDIRRESALQQFF
jgi:ABC-type multidrug transport system ATPase subunit